MLGLGPRAARLGAAGLAGAAGWAASTALAGPELRPLLLAVRTASPLRPPP